MQLDNIQIRKIAIAATVFSSSELLGTITAKVLLGMVVFHVASVPVAVVLGVSVVVGGFGLWGVLDHEYSTLQKGKRFSHTLPCFSLLGFVLGVFQILS